MRAEGEVLRLPTERVEARAHFDEFVEDEHERLFKALCFVSGSREDAEDLSQEAFLKLWERWDEIDRIADPTAYLFRVALNGFRMQRRRAGLALRRLLPSPPGRDEFAEVDTRADVRRLLLGLSTRQPVICQDSTASWSCSGPAIPTDWRRSSTPGGSASLPERRRDSRR